MILGAGWSGGAPASAEDCGPWLVSKGSPSLPAEWYAPVKGDIVVLQPYDGGSALGHIALCDGANWGSDFVQRDLWGGPRYRSAKPAYTIHRFPKSAPLAKPGSGQTWA